MVDQPIDELINDLDGPDDELIENVSKAAKSMLSDHVKTKFKESKDVYQLQYLQTYNCLRIMRGIVLSGWEGSGAVEVEGEQKDSLNWPLAAAISTNVLSILQDVYGTAIDAPFTISASELPQLPKDIKEWLNEWVQKNPETIQAIAGQDPADQNHAIDGMMAVAKVQAQEEANDAARQLDLTTKAEVRRGDFEREFKDFLYNYVVYPVAIMKGPTEVIRPVREWNEATGHAEVIDKSVLTVENISPFTFYPAPNAKCPQTAEYVINVKRYSAVEFSQLGMLDSYQANEVNQCMLGNPEGYTVEYCNGTNIDPTMNPHEWTLGSTPEARGFYDVLEFYGRVSGECLKDAGIENVKAHEWYEVEAEICDDFVLRVKVKTDGIVDRPFYATSFHPVTGSMYGESICSKLFNVQRVMEATIRELMANMGLASRPFTEINIDRIADDQLGTCSQLKPGAIKFTKNGMMGDNKPAYTFSQFPSNLNEMQQFMEYIMGQAYEVIGFSKASLGGAPGTVGRTSAGLSIALNQAAKPIKLKISDIGSKIVRPLVTHYVDNILETNPDPTLRGDINVYAKGIDGIVDKETRSQTLTEAMQALGQMGQSMSQPGPLQTLALNLFTEWCKVNDVPTKGLPNSDLDQAAAQSEGTAYQAQPPSDGQAQDGQLSPPPSIPPMDGRSGIAQQSIQASNNLPATMAR